jgi:hypothetical protein
MGRREAWARRCRGLCLWRGRDTIRAYRDTKPKSEASEAVALVGALVEAIADDGVRKRFLGLCKAADEIYVRTGNPPSAAIGLVTAALQRETALLKRRTAKQSAPAPKPKIGRPSMRTPELVEEFCARIANGRSVKDVCSDAGMPCQDIVYRWLDEDGSFADKLSRAREE